MSTTQPVSYAELLERAKSLHEQIRSWRREIHRYPELAFTEQRTAGLVNATLVSLGIPTETEVAKTGVVGHIHGWRRACGGAARRYGCAAHHRDQWHGV